MELLFKWYSDTTKLTTRNKLPIMHGLDNKYCNKKGTKTDPKPNQKVRLGA